MKHKGALIICVISLFLKLVVTLQRQKPCQSQVGHYGIVFLNDETHCDHNEIDSIEIPGLVPGPQHE